MDRRHDALLLVLPTLEYGGMEVQLLTLARAFRSDGGRVAFLAGPGPLEPEAAALGRLESVDWPGTPRVESAALARSMTGPDTAAVLQADPATIHLLGSLAMRGRVHLCLHNRPGTFEEWFAPSVLDRFHAFLPSLHATRRVGVSASNAGFATAHARAFGLSAEAVRPWLPGVDYPQRQSDVSAGPIRTVGVVCRLSGEKLAVVEAGALLVAAGREAGEDVRLEVHGGGPAERLARQVVEERVGPHHRFHGPTGRPLEVIEGMDVVVNAGRTAIEGLVLGRRVVTFAADRRASSPLGAPVSPERYARLRDANFLWPADQPVTADAVWREVRGADASEIRSVRDRARRELSAASLLRGHIAALAGTEVTATPPPSLTEALLDQIALLDDARAAAEALADALWAERRAGEPGA